MKYKCHGCGKYCGVVKNYHCGICGVEAHYCVDCSVEKYMKMKKETGEIVDELCTCGHLKSLHLDLPEITKHGITGDRGGRCGKCECARFTWSEFIYGKPKGNSGKGR